MKVVSKLSYYYLLTIALKALELGGVNTL